MDTTATLNNLEIEYGTSILSELCGQPLNRNQQPVRLFDQTRHSAEVYFRADPQGKPYVQDFQNGKRYYPATAYSQFYGLDFNTAKVDLCQYYYGELSANGTPQRTKRVERSIPLPALVDYIPADYYEQCRTHFERNALYEYLRFTYSLAIAKQVFARYRLGTSRMWKHYGYLATCLPQFDIAGNLRQVKVMAFDAMNGRRVKKYQLAERWNATTKHYQPTALDSDKSKIIGRFLPCYNQHNRPNLQQCFFGEHLLAQYPDQSVAIVEGESTAIVCSILWPQFVWLATGGSVGGSWYTPERFSVLRGRSVTLWPDTGKYDDWSRKANELRSIVPSLNVSDYVEKNAPVDMGNIDLRDLLTQPCYFPSDGSPIVYGEVIPVYACDNYPPEWDSPV